MHYYLDKTEKEKIFSKNNSFYSNSSNYFLDKNNEGVQGYKEFRATAKSYIKLIKEHIHNEDHPINIVSKYFINCFTDYMEENMIKICKSKNNPENLKNMYVNSDEIVHSLQKFVVNLQNSLRLFYCKTNNHPNFIEEKDEFINLITSLLFSEDALYKYIYTLFEITLFDKMDDLMKKMIMLNDITPQELGISNKFSLNEGTVCYQKKMIAESLKKE